LCPISLPDLGGIEAIKSQFSSATSKSVQKDRTERN